MDEPSLEISNLCIGTYAFMLAQDSQMHQQEAGLIGLSAIGRSLQGEFTKQARQNVQLMVIEALRSKSDLEPVDLEKLLQLLTKEPVLFGQRDRFEIIKNDLHAELADFVLGLFMSNNDKSTNPAMKLALKAGMKECQTDRNFWSEVQEVDYRNLVLGVLHKGEFANQVDTNLEFFLRSCTETQGDSSLTEPQFFCLALRFARLKHGYESFDKETRLLELQRALGIARTDPIERISELERHPHWAKTNAEVNSLNRQGKIDLATKVLKDAESYADRYLYELYDKGIAQAIITNNVDLACEYELAKISLNEYEPNTYLEACERVLSQWYEQGIQLAMVFDIEVANQLAHMLLDRVQLPEHEEILYNHIGKSFIALGERQYSESSNFRGAVLAFEMVLKARPREQMPLKWAEAQYNLGTALQGQGRIGQRMEKAVLLERAIDAYRCSLEERTRERTPMDWALTLHAIGNSLRSLFSCTKNDDQLQQAIIAYEQASEIITPANMPILWAKMRISIGQSLTELNSLSSAENNSQLKRIEQAKIAFVAASSIFSREASPIEWGKIQAELASVESACACHSDIEDGISHAHLALAYANAALEELDEFEHLFQYNDTIFLRDHLVKALAELDIGDHSG